MLKDHLRLSIFFFSIISVSTLKAADHYIRAAATGNGSGADWTNACKSFTGPCAPASMVRGDTYYVAEGTYTPASLNTPNSSTQIITIKKATEAAHGTNTGWNSTYGDGVAIFTKGFNISTSYWVIDGATGGGAASWKTGFGFYIDTRAGGVGVSISNGITGFVTVRHVEIEGTGDDGDCTGCGVANDGIYAGESTNNVFEYLYFHHQGRVPFFLRSDNTRIESSWVEHNESTPGEHSEGISAWKGSGAEVRNLVVANSVWKDMEGTGTLVCECNGWDVYGNVFWGVGGAGTGHGAVTSWSNSEVYNVRIHNNTFVNTSKGINFFVDGSYARSNITAYNNLFTIQTLRSKRLPAMTIAGSTMPAERLVNPMPKWEPAIRSSTSLTEIPPDFPYNYRYGACCAIQYRSRRRYPHGQCVGPGRVSVRRLS